MKEAAGGRDELDAVSVGPIVWPGVLPHWAGFAEAAGVPCADVAYAGTEADRGIRAVGVKEDYVARDFAERVCRGI